MSTLPRLTYYFIFYAALRVNMIGTIVLSSVIGLLVIWFTFLRSGRLLLNDIGDFDLSTEDLAEDCFNGLGKLWWEE